METQSTEKSLDDVTVKKRRVDAKQTFAFDFTEKTWKNDFVLIVENKRFHVTKAILAYASPVFDAMFQADFKEKKSSELELPGKKAEDVQHFLRCIYPNPADVNLETVKSILPLAEEYQVSFLKETCKEVLFQQVSKTISSDDLYDVLAQSSLYNMPDLLEKCVNVASTRTFESYQKANERMTISPEVKVMILERMLPNSIPKTLLNVVKGYEADLNSDKKLDIKDYKEWDGRSLNVDVTINEWKSFEVVLHDIKAQCKLRISLRQRFSSFKILSNTTREEVKKIRFFAKIVLQPYGQLQKAVSREIKFDYDENTEKVVEIPNFGLDLNQSGLIYHDRLAVGLHILAKIRA